MATAPAVLTVEIKYDTRQQERASEKLSRELTARAAKLESSLSEQAQKGEQQRVNIRKKAEEQIDAANARALNSQRLRWQKHYDSLAITEEKARLRSLKGQESWSSRMTKSLDGIALSIKGMAIAWGSAQIGNAIKGSVELAGGMRDAAAGVGLTAQQYFALTSAMRDAGVQAEKIDPMFTRLNDLISGGATEKQQTILDRLGISATGMTNVQLMDTLLEKINSRMITQADLGELVGTRIVPSWNRLAGEINNVNEANSRYKFPISDADVDKLDKMSMFWDKSKVNASLFFANAIVNADLLSSKLGPTLTALSLLIGGPGVLLGASAGMAAFGKGSNSNSSSTFDPFLTADEQLQFSPRRGSKPGGGSSIPSVIPIGFDGQRARPRRQAPDRSFDPIAISNALPVIIRGTDEWNQSLTDSLTNAERIEFSISKFASSDTWQVATAGAQAFTSIMSLQSQMIQNQVDGLNHVIEMERERWKVRSEAMRESGLESSAAYRNELREFEKMDSQRQKQAQRLQSKAFEVNKRAQIAGTVMNTSQAIMNALATVKPFLPVGLIMAALAGAQGSVQVATISGQQNPYKGYAFGGEVPGKSFGDDTPILTQGGEFVATRSATRRNKKALEYANAGGTLTGGVTVVINVQGDMVGEDYYVQTKLIPQIQRAINQGHKLNVNS